MARRWTVRAERRLIQGVGIDGSRRLMRSSGRSYDWINAPEGRSRNAVRCKLRRLLGGGSLMRGAYSLHRMRQLTGYSDTQLLRAMKALAQKWKRLSPTGPYLVYENQFADIVQWLAVDYWSKQHRLYNCVWCHQSTLVHRGKGLCLRCYNRYVKTLERAGLPFDNDDLLIVVGKQLREHRVVTERSLRRGRAIPEGVVALLRGDLCLC